MRIEDLFAWCFGGFIGLTALYVFLLLFCLRVIGDKGVKLIVSGLLTGIAATGYSIISRMVGEMHVNTSGMPTGISLDPAMSSGNSAPAILSRLAVVLVLGGVARMVAESLAKPVSGASSAEANHG
jgi:predicted phage tail protein